MDEKLVSWLAGIEKPKPVREDFVFSVIALDHGHIFGMSKGLVEAGAKLKSVYDQDPSKVAGFLREFPQTKAVRNSQEILDDQEVQLVASAGIPSERAALGLEVLKAGKDYFVDKAPLTTLEQLDEIRSVSVKHSRKYMVYYSERLHNESAVAAGYLIKQGIIGRVLNVIGMGPHRLNVKSRPAWFFEREKYGGILCDIGSHQIEQFLYYSGACDAEITNANVANYHHPGTPGLEDFGEANLIGDNGASNYFKVDWFTPDGLGTWGDGRTFVTGTDGYIELRKFIDVARWKVGNQLYVVTQFGEHHFDLDGKVGYPFFTELIKDCLYRSDHAMTQDHALKAAELAVQAQLKANERV
jgi:predicted dehydrogenase